MCSPGLTTKTGTGKSVFNLNLITGMQMSLYCVYMYVFIICGIIQRPHVVGFIHVHCFLTPTYIITKTLRAAWLLIDNVEELYSIDREIVLAV